MSDLEIPEGFTPGPWHSCRNGECKCSVVMCNDHPVCQVTRGEWGDDYPDIRSITDENGDVTFEPFMAQFTYGEVSDSAASANARLIALAPAMADEIVRLRAEVRRLRDIGLRLVDEYPAAAFGTAEDEPGYGGLREMAEALGLKSRRDVRTALTETGK